MFARQLLQLVGGELLWYFPGIQMSQYVCPCSFCVYPSGHVSQSVSKICPCFLLLNFPIPHFLQGVDVL